MQQKDWAHFSFLWTCLAKEWRGVQGNRKKREILELLCGALWQVQEAYKIGKLPHEPLQKVYPGNGKPLWQAWVDEGKWFCPPTAEFTPTMQSMFIADAIMRLDGIRDVLRGIGHAKGCRNTVLPDRREVNGWLKSKLPDKNNPNILEQIAILIAFRDRYTHGEVADADFTKKYPKLAQFRDKELRDDYSLADVAKYSLEVLSRYLQLVRCLDDPTKFTKLLTPNFLI